MVKNKKSKIVNIELKGFLLSQFDIIKSKLRIKNDVEVIHFLIQNYYKEHLEGVKKETLDELEKDQVITKKFMKKYGEEWSKLGEDK